MKGGGSVKGPILSDAQLEQTGPEAPSCELYRATAIGKSLMETLKTLVSEDKVPPSLAVRVMKAFDRNMFVALERDQREYGDQYVRMSPRICTSFKNIEDVWNFQLSDVMIEMNFPVFMTASKQPEPAIGVSQPKTNYVRVADTSRFYVRDLKLTTADHRLFLSLEKGKQALGRAPKKPRTDAGG